MEPLQRLAPAAVTPVFVFTIYRATIIPPAARLPFR